MEVLPTPQSIAIASLISLYSDPNSPLYPNHDDDDPHHDSNDNNNAASPSTSWPTRLSSLIRQLVREEEEGNLFHADGGSSTADEKDDDFEMATVTSRNRNRRSTRPTTTIGLPSASLSSLLRRIDAAFSQRRDARSRPSSALLEKLSVAAKSIEHLSEFVDECLALLEGRGASPSFPVSIDGNSSLGRHLRKLCLGMEELPFEALSRLWVCFRDFVGAAVRAGRQEGGDEWHEQRWMLSSSQVEKIVRRSCWRPDVESLLTRSELGRRGVSWEEDVRPIADPLHHQLHHQQQRSYSFDLLKTHPECPSLHFLHYYSALLNKERSRALEYAHRYFDYGMIHERKERVERNMLSLLVPGGTGNGNGSGGSNRGGGDGYGMATGRITTATSGETTAPHPRGRNANANNALATRKYRESNMMQYAAIVLAQMYHRFGYMELARQATEEAIRVGQQSGDEECVSFARGWLAYLSSGGEKDSVGNLRRCRLRAVEGGAGLVSLVAGTCFELGRREAWGRIGWGDGEDDELESNEEGFRGIAGGASVAWESIQSAGRVSPVFGPSSGGGVRGLMMGSSVSGTGGGGIGGGQLCMDVDNMTSNDALRILGQQSMAISGLWDSTGHTSMASLSSRAALYGYSSELTAEDAAFSMRRALASLTFGPGLDTWAMEYDQGRGAMSQDCSVYYIYLNHMSSLYGKGSVTDWVESAASILHEWSVRSYDLNISRILQCILANHAAFPSRTNFAVEAKLVSLSRSTHLHIQTGDFASAKVDTRRAYMLAKTHSLLLHQGWQLLQLALVDLEAATASPSVNASVERSLHPLLQCLHLSKQHAMDPLRAVALTTLAKILLCMGRFLKARSLLNAAMPLVMQHGHLWFQAEACLTLAKCNLAEARSKLGEAAADLNANTVKRKKTAPGLSSIQSPIALQRKAFSQLEKAASLFSKIDDIHRLRQTYYLQALVSNSLPCMQRERDEFAKKFAQVSARRQSSSKLWIAMQELLLGDSIQLAHSTTL